jgi:hypothetical protein
MRLTLIRDDGTTVASVEISDAEFEGTGWDPPSVSGNLFERLHGELGDENTESCASRNCYQQIRQEDGRWVHVYNGDPDCQAEGWGLRRQVAHPHLRCASRGCFDDIEQIDGAWVHSRTCARQCDLVQSGRLPTYAHPETPEED